MPKRYDKCKINPRGTTLLNGDSVYKHYTTFKLHHLESVTILNMKK